MKRRRDEKDMLLHCCCFACSINSVISFKEDGYKPELFWYNPNIHPYKEYKARLTALEAYAKEEGLKVCVSDFYGLRYFIHNLNGEFSDSCGFC